VVETTLKTLIERFRSKPEWQSPDPAVRAEAVLRLAASERDVALALAREDPDARVRRAAVKKLSEVEPLAAIAARDEDPAVRDEAEQRLVHVALHEHDEATARAAVAGLREPRHLAAAAKSAPLAAAREAAVRGLSDPKALASVVREAPDNPTRLLALARIEDGATLLALALKLEHKAVAVAAVDRIADPEALRSVAAKAKAPSAARRARARLETGEPAAPAAPPAPVPSPADDEAERRAYEETLARLEQERAERARARSLREELVASLYAAQGDSIPAAIAEAREVWAGLPPLEGAEHDALDGRVSAAIAAAEKRHLAWLAGLARRDELAELVEQAEALAGQELATAQAAVQGLEARWREATAQADLPELRERFLAAVGALEARARAARDEVAQRDRRHLEELAALAGRAEALVARGVLAPLRDAEQALREIRAALDHPGHFPTRKDRDAVLARLEAARRVLYPLVQQLREDAEWKRWANVTVQEELCAEAEALLGEENAEKAAAALRDLDARWKQAKEAPKEKAEALWKRFKAARDQVKERTDAFFAKQAEELAANLARKQALCEKAEALAESTDWTQTAERLRALQAEWKTIGPVPRAASQRLWERFRRPCDRFFTRWQEHRAERGHEWAENLAKKEALCERAEALRDSTDWEAASSELKRLQAEWRSIGPVKKSRSEAVWQRFRAACDRFFDRYKNRDEHARQAAQQAREGLCAELEALLPPEGEAGEPPADLVARVQAAQTAWRQAGGLPHDEMAALDERFARARDRLVLAFAPAFQGTDLDPEASRKKAERLVERVESVLAELAPDAGADRPKTAEELAARLRDALATNTIGGRAAVEARWHSASVEVESAQAAWKRLGPLTGETGRELAARFARACERFFAARPRLERPREEPRPRRDRERRPQPSGAERR
jgi:hypothetical protein